jgi:hypothetical protein
MVSVSTILGRVFLAVFVVEFLLRAHIAASARMSGGEAGGR